MLSQPNQALEPKAAQPTCSFVYQIDQTQINDGDLEQAHLAERASLPPQQLAELVEHARANLLVAFHANLGEQLADRVQVVVHEALVELAGAQLPLVQQQLVLQLCLVALVPEGVRAGVARQSFVLFVRALARGRLRGGFSGNTRRLNVASEGRLEPCFYSVLTTVSAFIE